MEPAVPPDAAPGELDAAPAPSPGPASAEGPGPATILLDRTIALTELLNDRSRSRRFVELSAAAVSVTIVRQCGPPKDWEIRSRSLATVEERRAWHRRVSASWGADCLLRPTSWCRWTDALFFDPTDALCVPPCCHSTSGATRAGAPAITRACFDPDGKLTELTIADGC